MSPPPTHPMSFLYRQMFLPQCDVNYLIKYNFSCCKRTLRDITHHFIERRHFPFYNNLTDPCRNPLAISKCKVLWATFNNRIQVAKKHNLMLFRVIQR